MEHELIEVEAVLYDGERIALRTGNMWTLYRVVHDALSGETSFEHDGLATLTGAHHAFRRAVSASAEHGDKHE